MSDPIRKEPSNLDARLDEYAEAMRELTARVVALEKRLETRTPRRRPHTTDDPRGMSIPELRAVGALLPRRVFEALIRWPKEPLDRDALLVNNLIDERDVLTPMGIALRGLADVGREP